MFITTANTLSQIPVPLQDRMEIINLSGYTEFEKLNIATRYLVPKQLRDAGLDVPVFDARWEALGETHPARYDLIFHDALHWVEAPEAMIS